MAKKKTKFYLDITNCLVIGNARRVKDKKEPIKSIHALSDEFDTNYTKLYRYQKDGFYKRPETEISNIMEILMVKENELVKKF